MSSGSGDTARSPASDGLASLLGSVRALLSSLDSSRLQEFLQEWPSGTLHAPTPATLPVLACLPQLRGGAESFAAEPFAAELVSEFCRLAPSLAWRQTYRARTDAGTDAGADAAVDEAFLRNYGWCALIGPDGPLRSERLAVGCLLLGPRTTYPNHRHEAEEIYVPLAGIADWLQGDGLWRERRPGEVIHHERHERHAMRTRAAALLALYLWRSADLHQHASLDPPGTS